MNRNEEFRTYLRELEETPVRGGDVTRAKRKLRRKNALRALGSVAAALALVMVVLLNVSPTVAKAVSDLPGMEGIVRAVRLGRALEEARDLGYAQPIDWEGQAGDMTFHVDYMLADGRCVSVFFRMETDGEPKHLMARTNSSSKAGDRPTVSYVQDLGDGKYCAKIQFSQKTPAAFDLLIGAQGEVGSTQLWWQGDHIALRLTPDPEKTIPTRKAEVNQTFRLDGQTLTITEVEIGLHQMFFTVHSDKGNDYNLTGLDFYFMTQDGHRLNVPEFGTTAWISFPLDNGDRIFSAETPIFYDYGDLTLYIERATFGIKGKENARIDLENGVAEGLPETATLVSTEKDENGVWTMVIRSDDLVSGGFAVNIGSPTKDRRGPMPMKVFDSWESETVGEGDDAYHLVTMKFSDYDGTEIWIGTFYDHVWRCGGEPCVVALPMPQE